MFNDRNGDGIQQANEVGIAAVTVRLVDANGNPVGPPTLTGPDGSYSFTMVDVGSYTAQEVDLASYVSTTNNIIPVSMVAGGIVTVDFGDQQKNSVSGTVFDDANGNCVQDETESGIGGVTVKLYTSSGTLVGTRTTAPDGSYTFTNVAPGAYQVKETDPPSYASTTSNTVPVSVPTGGSATADFGDRVQGTVTGTVFNDLNGDGIQQPNEIGIVGVMVELFGADGNPVATATTTADGSYLFPGVAPGTYTVQETDANGYVSTTSNGVPVVVAPSGIASADFGDRKKSTVSGTVFYDWNGDGLQDAGDFGIGGVVVKLLDNNGHLVATTTTLADGSYLFPVVGPGTYTVQESDPSGFVSTTDNDVKVVVPAGGAGAANFGDQQKGTVGGVVFNDINGDGVQQATELGIGGVTVQLFDGGGNPVGSPVMTVGDGTYLVTQVTPGSYTVRETDPSGYVSTTQNALAVTVPAGGTGTANFGDRQPGTVGGNVFNDRNGDGVRQAYEAGIGGVTVSLYDSNGNLVATTTTLPNGDYLFPSTVPPGEYTIAETDPSGFVSTTANSVKVVVPSGGAASVDFGDQQKGVVSGVVFNDANGDGLQQPTERGIGGVLVKLFDGEGNVVATQTTQADGNYVFPDVAAGTYAVHETDPTGFVSTTDNDVPVVVPSGGSGNANFGDREKGTVSGKVFNDVNGDGMQQASEAGIGGVTVKLFDSKGHLVATTTTLPDGGYVFAGVVAGTYTLQETDPSGFVSTTDNSVQLVVPAGGSSSANFGDQHKGTIGGNVFNDRNGDGQQQASEPGIGGVTVTLLNSGGGVVATTTTLPDGSYLFTALQPGDYSVRETDPNGYVSTTNNLVATTVPPNGAGSANFGDRQRNTVSGTVFNDRNDNDIQDPGEAGIGGVTVTLLNSGGSVVATTTTLPDGTYVFSGVQSGDYIVQETDPSGFVSTTENMVNISVPPNGAASANFGDLQPPDLSIQKILQGDLSMAGGGTYIIRVTNAGPGATVGPITVTDPMPAGLTLISATGSGWDCSMSTPQSMQCEYDHLLLAGQSAPDITLQVKVRAPEGTVIRNVAAASTKLDPNPGNDQSESVRPVTTPAPVPMLSGQGVVALLGLLLVVAARGLRKRAELQ